MTFGTDSTSPTIVFGTFSSSGDFKEEDFWASIGAVKFFSFACKFVELDVDDEELLEEEVRFFLKDLIYLKRNIPVLQHKKTDKIKDLKCLIFYFTCFRGHT